MKKSFPLLAVGIIAGLLLIVQPAAAQWSRNGGAGDTYLTNSGDEVGIGLSNPARQLHVRGENAVFRLDRSINSPGFIISRTQAGIPNPLKTFLFGVTAWAQDEGRFVIEDLHQNAGGTGDVRFAIDENGDVGIGIRDPREALEVAKDGRVFIGDGGGADRRGLLIDGREGGERVRLHAYNYQSDISMDLILNPDPEGYVGIGTNYPEYKLHVSDGDIAIDNNYEILFEDGNGSYSAGIYMSTSSNLYIGNNAGDLNLAAGGLGALSIQTDADFGGMASVDIATLLSNGTVYNKNGVLTATDPSSRDYKSDIEPVDLKAKRVLKLEPKSFIWKDNGRKDFGYIAEEVKEVLPELYRDTEGAKGYASDKLRFYMIEVLKEQENRIAELEDELKTLKAKLDTGK